MSRRGLVWVSRQTLMVQPNATLNGTVSYAAQLPWIQNTTVEGNILFGLPMERQVYEQTLAT